MCLGAFLRTSGLIRALDSSCCCSREKAVVGALTLPHWNLFLMNCSFGQVFGAETRCIIGERRKTRRHVSDQMNSQDMLSLVFHSPSLRGSD